MSLTLTLPLLEAHPADPPETRPAKVAAWLGNLDSRDAPDAARALIDALGRLNRFTMPESRRFDLAEHYAAAADRLWPLLERRFARGPHPLAGDALDAARLVLGLSHELSIAYKHLLTRESERRLLLVGSTRHAALLVHRCLATMVRTITNSYLAYVPVAPTTWLDVHRVYTFARDRGVQHQALPDDRTRTPERIYVEVLLLALANPYGLSHGQLGTVNRYLSTHAHAAKLTDVQPVHRMAKAVAVVPVGHDFPPFSANKGGAIEGRKLFLLTYDLAFQMQEELQALESGGKLPAGIAGDSASRRTYIALLRRLLRQWAIPPARQFNRVASRAPVTACAGLPAVTGLMEPATGAGTAARKPAAMTRCEVINHTPAGYALRQVEKGNGMNLRVGELVALCVDGRHRLQIAAVRWFRNTAEGGALEFGCELLCDAPELARAAPESALHGERLPVLVLPEDAGHPEASPKIIVPTTPFRVEQAITLERGGKSGFAVLTKLIEQGPGFELYEFIAVS